VKSKKKSAPRVAFSTLLEDGYIQAGQKMLFSRDKARSAKIKPDARLIASDGFEGSIHQVGKHYMNGSPCNGWEHWYIKINGSLVKLDEVRKEYRKEKGLM